MGARAAPHGNIASPSANAQTPRTDERAKLKRTVDAEKRTTSSLAAPCRDLQAMNQLLKGDRPPTPKNVPNACCAAAEVFMLIHKK
jgi:hypothetical protein